MTNFDKSWDYVNVRDFDHLDTIWNSLSAKTDDEALQEAERLGVELKSRLDLPISILDANASKFFKMVHVDYTRLDFKVLDKE